MFASNAPCAAVLATGDATGVATWAASVTGEASRAEQTRTNSRRHVDVIPRFNAHLQWTADPMLQPIPSSRWIRFEREESVPIPIAVDEGVAGLEADDRMQNGRSTWGTEPDHQLRADTKGDDR